MRLVFDLTFCGDLGNALWGSSCPEIPTTCEEYVGNNPKNMSEAYWSVRSLNVFQRESKVAVKVPPLVQQATTTPQLSAKTSTEAPTTTEATTPTTTLQVQTTNTPSPTTSPWGVAVRIAVAAEPSSGGFSWFGVLGFG
eukprot:CAMPEP_0177404802 /NCGR_PEP_ID=MMETSP0368-20130122/61611_1 /TAXON_ID=447022 ORGANISM="Scrippsiella hangoei-like, Strain SHHI-4" /NCGR_SAMPLE_ID=MMETSP0368 /ASSEMBLY_ACC=CAM_ASM_000363 /LENGTH=138 /DNA_ID=CAMNT_0018872941 /DNA_START=88 /DNA_END=500 /DNA_ORIENTATION=-